jgi:hypothetical protein
MKKMPLPVRITVLLLSRYATPTRGANSFEMLRP